MSDVHEDYACILIRLSTQAVSTLALVPTPSFMQNFRMPQEYRRLLTLHNLQQNGKFRRSARMLSVLEIVVR